MIRVGLDILKTTVSKVTNRILVQIGNVLGGVAELDDVEWIQHYGFYSRPPKAAAGKSAAQVVMVEDGGRNVVIGSIDQRGLELAGNAKDGEAGIFSAGEDGNGQARVICKSDGSVNVYTTDTNTKDGQSVYLRVAPDGLSFVAPWGTLRFDDTGFHVLHSSGASFDLGGVYGLPAPLNAFGSYVRAQAATISMQGAAHSFGGAGGEALAKAPDVISAIENLQAQILEMQTAWAALGALTGPVLGVMLQPIAAPIAAAAPLQTAAVVQASLTMPAATSSK